jgi:hypothetical protein
MWKLVSFRLEMVLILTQDRCTMELLGDEAEGKLVLVRLETVLILTRCTVCAEHTKSSEIS